jgi:hypothetical protein
MMMQFGLDKLLRYLYYLYSTGTTHVRICLLPLEVGDKVRLERIPFVVQLLFVPFSCLCVYDRRQKLRVSDRGCPVSTLIHLKALRSRIVISRAMGFKNAARVFVIVAIIGLAFMNTSNSSTFAFLNSVC